MARRNEGQRKRKEKARVKMCCAIPSNVTSRPCHHGLPTSGTSLWVSVWRRSMSIVQMSPFPLEVPLRERERVLLEGPLGSLKRIPSVRTHSEFRLLLPAILSIYSSLMFLLFSHLSIYLCSTSNFHLNRLGHAQGHDGA